MKIRVLWLGRNRNAHYSALCDDYVTRILRFHPCEAVTLRESARRPRTGEPRLTPQEESLVLQQMEGSPCTVLLDVGGKEMDSDAFAAFLENHRMRGIGRLDFFLGGPWGWTEPIRRRATTRLKLSRLTLPHELARVVLLEQLYRALARLHGLPYHK